MVNYSSIDGQRKDDHYTHALDQQGQFQASPFDSVRFVHHSFSRTQYDQVDLSTSWGGHRHSSPFYINGMTGGTLKTKEINRKLAILARETGLAMASGSNSIALKHPEVADSFQVIRQENPQGFVMANLGGHHPLENAQKVVDMLEADAIQIHLNTPQEIVMPEGDRDFSMWLDNIHDLVTHLGRPVIVKEVGFGMSQETIQALLDIGVETIDISGRGGTNFVRIENARRQDLDFTALSDWGQTTPEALLEAQAFIDQVHILASGGIRHFTHVLKALALGAKGVGVSGFFLQAVDRDLDEAIQLVRDWQEALRLMMVMLNVDTIEALGQVALVLGPDLAHWCQQRGLDSTVYAQRSPKVSR